MQEYKLFINGEWVNSSSGETFDDINPATLEVIAKLHKATEEDVQRAVDSAHDAFEKWSRTPAPSRGKILFRAARMLEERKEELARLMTIEMGKILKETRGDVQEAIDITYYAAGEGRRLLGETTPSELPDKFSMTVRRPIGVIGLITPWNFPIAIPAWKIMPALISGNTIVFKPASDTPLLSIELVKILAEAGLPKGVLNLVMGEGSTVGSAIVHNKGIRAISFTGSVDTGKWILGEASRDMKRVSLELGGKNPVIVMDDANLALAIDGVLWGAFGTTGQRCTAASRVIVHEKILPEFQKRLIERTKQLRLGNGIDETTDVGPVINNSQLQKVAKYVNIGKEEGAKLVLGGNIVKPLPGYFFEPTIFTDVSPDMRIAQEEIFGPVLSLISAASLDEAIGIANSVIYGLSSSIYTENIKNSFMAIEKIEAGITYINAPPIGAEIHLPFGGVKATGNGTREAGTTAIEEFTELKTVYFDYSGKLQKAQIDVAQEKL
ncbi:aldehyde dehydrogenase family protein [Candidatus Methanoperedens nitratireducens]|uniref:Aldehyde dehydrogenase, thermostable n=1 Tax=Candidatus Methanoperedens nitratireducens TaxID=1392998 RepID=A0A284VM56_9EURY|nr:aldehyde dehydrogenase family protein [Candidatus Methanoperedens nitroreducens]SNQ60366.1 Aldehyde dehydrogenase, thermostable [Candidatus Methanoperedens nitroreducens]